MSRGAVGLSNSKRSVKEGEPVALLCSALTVQGSGSSILLPQALPAVSMSGRALVVLSLERLGAQSHNDTCAGCIVSSTTATSLVHNQFKSTSSRIVVLKAASVFTASYLRL